jgi:hypothetical protein
MRRTKTLLRSALLAAAVSVLSWGVWTAPDASAASCSEDCGCKTGNTPCCTLTTGAVCLTRQAV